MFCKKCGAQLRDGTRFCSKCGANLNAVNVQKSEREVRFDQKERFACTKKKYAIAIAVILSVLVAAGLLFVFFVLPNMWVNAFKSQIQKGEFREAYLAYRKYDPQDRTKANDWMCEYIASVESDYYAGKLDYSTTIDIFEDLMRFDAICDKVQKASDDIYLDNQSGIAFEKAKEYAAEERWQEALQELGNVHTKYRLFGEASNLETQCKTTIRETVINQMGSFADNGEIDKLIAARGDALMVLPDDKEIVQSAQNCLNGYVTKTLTEAKTLTDKKDYSGAVKLLQSAVEKYEHEDLRNALEEYADSLVEETLDAARTLAAERKFEEAISTILEVQKIYNCRQFVNTIDEYSRCIVKVVAGAYHNLALYPDGSVTASGVAFHGEDSVEDWDNIIDITATDYVSVGLKRDGTVVATGANDYGQCDVSDWRDIIAIASSSWNVIGLKKDGTVVATGRNNCGQCDLSSWSGISQVAIGTTHAVGLRSDGTVVATGDNEYGQCDVSTWTDIVSVKVAYLRTIGLKSDGTVVATGGNFDGECDVNKWSDIVAIDTDGNHTVGLKADGTVVAAGFNTWESEGACDVEDWYDIVAVDVGFYRIIGLKENGTVVVVGWNDQGQCEIEDLDSGG